MKAGVTPELSQKWWRSNKPTTLKSTGLGKALGDHEKVAAELEKAVKAGSWPRIQAAIDECDRHTGSKLPAAVKKARGMCDRKKHAETIAALDKYDAVFRQEATRQFTTAWSALQKLQSGLNGVAKDAAATVTDAAKYTRDVKALAVELKGGG